MPPNTGHFILHSNVMPRITAGRYQLSTRQTGQPFEVEPEITHIQVSSPRFTMPTDQVLSSFPPANAEGAFGERLPQIVLKRRTLPWERNPAGGLEPSQTPWLALVVVAEGEAELSTATRVADCVTPGTSLSHPEDRDVEQGLYLAVTETVVRKIFPCREDLPLLAHVREVDVNDTELANGDDDGWLAVILANRLPVFDHANGKAVRYMACLVNLEGQLDALPPPQTIADSFVFELAQDWSVLANLEARSPDLRVLGGLPMPQPLRTPRDTPVAAAVSAPTAKASPMGPALDGMASIRDVPVTRQWSPVTAQVTAAAREPDAKVLVRDTMAKGFRLPIELYAREKTLRFPVLSHWSFTTAGEVDFENLMKDLDVGLLGTLPEAPAPAATVPEVVQTGHIGLDHRTRRGDPVRAWYRGPCVPFPTARNGDAATTAAALAHSADQLRRVIPDGREDLGLAAAFEIGRLMALSQLSVVSALLRFRAEQFGAGRVRELLAGLVGFELPTLGAARVDLGRFVALHALTNFTRDPGTTFGLRRPVADPGRPLRISGDLDAVIAEGLGLDLSAVRKQADSIGVIAALGSTTAPLASPGRPPSDKVMLPALQAALRGELQRTLEVAAPKKAVQRDTRARSGAASRTPVRDALDELLDSLAADERVGDEDGEETP
ncbi:hypothetical protein MNQ95_14680 [Pseudoxanthomonas daejeonensis]|uniref:Uncharacterized protein n=1 Tax=Pseudoxanthomonas daejeonensis TaxID=266062 RepID=A0ABQ6Z607_9GAMM|nr:hypothetical protein [Pseudoxanthomonas daejeonensis]KAF1693985.1 hypothetical protein CSC65_09995 [Pseudoxanthomonas daejeonensis]UNK57358.1 hypothetical protein MNQ95_14680 [Pseudoxanthomonas daejeonensis]